MNANTEPEKPKESSKPHGLAKGERLHNVKEIEQLYSQGNSFLKHPLRVVFYWKPLSSFGAAGSFGAQVIFSVSKRNFKRAHDRNLIKRRMKEAYRLNKHLLISTTVQGSEPLVYIFSMQYIAKEILPFAQIEKRVISALRQLTEHAMPPKEAKSKQ